MRRAVQEWGWLVPAFAVSAALGVLVLPSVLPRAPWLSIVGVLVVLVICFPTSARRDPIAFASIAIPPLTVTVIGLLLPAGIGRWLNIAALLFLLPFVFSGRWWSAWSRVVLRRHPSPRHAFYRRLHARMTAMYQGYEEASERGQPRDDALSAFRTGIAQLRALEAPDPDWAQVRDDSAANAEAWLELASGSSLPEAVHRFEADRDALAARIEELRTARDAAPASARLDRAGRSRPQAPGSATES